MDFAALEIFSAVATERSVTRAAARLDRVQSNVTTRLRQLEDELGTALFRREGRRMTLTGEGATFRAYADRLLALVEEARQAVRPASTARSLRIGTMESTAASRLPSPLAALHARQPALSATLTLGPTRWLVAEVLAGRLDCAFIARPVNDADFATGSADDVGPDAGLDMCHAFTEELLLVLPAGHGPVAGPADLQVTTLAVMEPGCTYRGLAERWLRGTGANGPAAGGRCRVLELRSYHALFASVAAGSCAGVAPHSLLALQPPPALETHSLGAVETLLIWRAGSMSPALAGLRSALSAP